MKDNELNKERKSPRGWYSRGYLPHFDCGEVAQFITFRLADSLPQNVLAQWKAALERGEITHSERRQQIENYLDQNYGSCALRDERIAKLIEENLAQV